MIVKEFKDIINQIVSYDASDEPIIHYTYLDHIDAANYLEIGRAPISVKTSYEDREISDWFQLTASDKREYYITLVPERSE